jgi:hypothetical protein
MAPLEKVADFLDKIHRSNMEWIDHYFQKQVDFWNRGEDAPWYMKAGLHFTAFTAGVMDHFIGIQEAIAFGLITDPLRMGTGFQKGTAWGIAEDAFRLIGLVGGVGGAALRIVRVAKSMSFLSEGGVCTIAAFAKAVALSGHRLSQVAAFEWLAKELGGATFNAKTFTGVKWDQIPGLLTFLTDHKIKWIRVYIPGVSKIEITIKQARAPVVVQLFLRWKDAGMWHQGYHAMMGFHDGFGRYWLADQQGAYLVKDFIKKWQPAIAGPGIIIPEAAVLKQIRAGTAVFYTLGVLLHYLDLEKVEARRKEVNQILGRQETDSPHSEVRQGPLPPSAAPLNKPPGPIQKSHREIPNPPGAGTVRLEQICVQPNSDVLPICHAKRTYIVKAGDRLFDIAKRIYGDGWEYLRIYGANVTSLGSNPNHPKLIPGQQLLIP